jgi:hypothetical protein
VCGVDEEEKKREKKKRGKNLVYIISKILLKKNLIN